jgi:hypothetical protein
MPINFLFGNNKKGSITITSFPLKLFACAVVDGIQGFNLDAEVLLNMRKNRKGIHGTSLTVAQTRVSGSEHFRIAQMFTEKDKTHFVPPEWLTELETLYTKKSDNFLRKEKE